ncbi:hypothetical protein SXCC_02179 [Gluconacetobacter sp. SXCC-1]|nr:hypothetical protein SXCC_02179 [Gluconacetobacter sp. SXCC-1]
MAEVSQYGIGHPVERHGEFSASCRISLRTRDHELHDIALNDRTFH